MRPMEGFSVRLGVRDMAGAGVPRDTANRGDSRLRIDTSPGVDACFRRNAQRYWQAVVADSVALLRDARFGQGGAPLRWHGLHRAA